MAEGYAGRSESRDPNVAPLSLEIEEHAQRISTTHQTSIDGKSAQLSAGVDSLTSAVAGLADRVKSDSQQESRMSL